MSDRTLLVLAAGRSTRYGRLKQTDPVGPSGETMVDYSVFDALRAGFTSLVFVVRTDIERAFRDAVGRRIERGVERRGGGRVEVRYAFQDRTGPPRDKPWGTVPALLAAADVVGGPFGVVNADDFYGRGSFDVLAGHLGADPGRGALVGFALRNTLSESGGVTRGICEVGPGSALSAVAETFDIVPDGAGARERSGRRLTGDEVVSMNMWGLPPDAFGALRGRWEAFLAAHRDSPTAELPVPDAVTGMIGRRELDVTVLPTGERWFGMTHPADRPAVVGHLRALVERGGYPADLWGSR